MAGVILRTADGTLLFVAFLWLVRIDDYRVAGMMLTSSHAQRHGAGGCRQQR